ncbi:MAG TPA: hypothetical protein VJS13_00845 [Pyrinomonadaceae bacterium]|nr:hypothetical protein [Pyrinomonadaceae bacterium]
MRFEIIAAFVIGALLPILETARRGISHWAINFTTMFEDYLGGALLLIGGWAAYRSKSWGAVFLLLAWGSICGLMTSSFMAQVEATLRGTATEPHNLIVVLVKLLLWSVSMTSLVLSFRSATRTRSA